MKRLLSLRLDIEIDEKFNMSSASVHQIKPHGINVERMGKLLAIVADATGVDAALAMSKSRVENAAKARHIFAHLSNTLLRANWTEIGRFLNRDRSTCSKGVVALKQQFGYDKELAAFVESIRHKVSNTKIKDGNA